MRHFGLAILVFLFAFPASATAWTSSAVVAGSPWDRLSGRGVPAIAGTQVAIKTRKSEAYTLDHAAQRSVLADAPRSGTGVVLTIPTPDGTLERFRAVESPVLAPSLGRQFPQIRTYTAEGVDDPTASAHFDLTPLGFHASVRSERGLWYVDPRFRSDKSVYASYYRADLVDRQGPLEEPEAMLRKVAPRIEDGPEARAPGDQVVKRVYRLAIANDPTYATYFGSTDLLVESAKATLVNRMNQLYNDDLAIRMELVANDYLLNFDTPAEYNAQYSGVDADCNGGFITRNDVVIDAIVGSANYDVGHFVGGGGTFNGGGVAGLGVVGTGSKGRGCTGLNPPVGDGFAIDYVAHEIGHQFGGNHTFNGVSGNCTGTNRNGPTAVEIGSGSSIQAYAGICGADNTQPHSDPYFSQRSVDEITTFVTGANSDTRDGFTQTVIANRSPVVAPPASAVIPPRTPFTLTGTAVDADGDGLVYLWEQNDVGTASALLNNTKLDGPLFRVFGAAANVANGPGGSQLYNSPGENLATEAGRARSFPDAAQVAADNTNAETGLCPAASTPPTATQIECFSEFLPPNIRALNFRLTARDRDNTGGGLSFANTQLTVAGTTPFAVTAPSGPQNLTGNTPVTVTWVVAGTNAPPFNSPDVKISYSTDGGLTFNYVALASTVNDGSESVVVPNVATTQGRFKVEAIGNYFYDVSDGNLAVVLGSGAPAAATPTATPSPTAAPTVDPITVPTATATATATATPTATVTATATATATATVPPAATATATATTTPIATSAATATVTPITSVTPPGTLAPPNLPGGLPGRATLEPDLKLVPRRAGPDRQGRVTLRVRCKAVTVGTPPPTCTGRAALTYKLAGRTRKAGSARFSFGSSEVGVATIKLKRRVRERLVERPVRAALRVTVGGRSATKRLRIALN